MPWCYNCDEELESEEQRRGYDNEECIHCYEPDEEGEYIDPEARDRRDRARGRILSYSTNVLNFHDFKKGPKDINPMFTGVELEVGWTIGDNGRSEFLKKLYDTLGYAIFKSDGSVTDGFEIVTAPASLAYHRKQFKKALPMMAGTVTGWRGRGCGMHVHVGRETFKGPSPKAHIYKWTQFINDPRNVKFMSLIAGRDIETDSWCSIEKTKIGYANPRTHDRYRAVNFGKGPTLECRIFKSNIAPRGFFKNLDFIYASVEFTRQAGISPDSLSVDAFINWLKKNQHNYYFLGSFLHERFRAEFPLAMKRHEKEATLEG